MSIILLINIFLKGIVQFVDKRKANGPVLRNSYLPAVIKNRRNTLCLTLHETTMNICSEAFLSKVERNQMDPVNERVARLCERLNIDYESLIELDSNELVEDLLMLYINGKYEEILILDEIDFGDIYIAKNELLKAYKALIRNDYNELNKIIIKLDAVKDCLNDLELFALILVVFEFYMHTMQYKKARVYINLLIKLDLDDKHLKLFVEERYFVLSCKIESSNTKYLFEKLQKNFTKFSITKQFYFSVLYNAYLGTEEALENIENMGNDFIPENYKEEYLYAKCFILVKLHRYLDAMEFIKKVATKDIRFGVLFAYSLNCLTFKQEESKNKKLVSKTNIDFDFDNFDDYEEEDKVEDYENLDLKAYMKDLVEIVKNADQTIFDTYNIAFLRLMQFELDKAPTQTICNFIKNNLLKELADFYYPLYDNYINYRYYILLGKLCRYKDAYMFLFKDKNHLKKNVI